MTTTETGAARYRVTGRGQLQTQHASQTTEKKQEHTRYRSGTTGRDDTRITKRTKGRRQADRGDFGDFGVSFEATVAGRYTRRGGPRLSVQGRPLLVLTRGP